MLLNSCGSLNLPDKPSLNICAHSTLHSKVFCVNNQTGEASDFNIDQTDNWIMFSPDDWGLLLKYIRVIELRFPSKIAKRESRKILNTNKIIQEKLQVHEVDIDNTDFVDDIIREL